MPLAFNFFLPFTHKLTESIFAANLAFLFVEKPYFNTSLYANALIGLVNGRILPTTTSTFLMTPIEKQFVTDKTLL
jgi:hypothetical protein